ncbi:MAG: T9SS type B sorting domain-containing protein [Flavobacteriaceae bacterium]|nr:T9SS type B sorting domain-containing protein [Flavobacteriaceae bacterium]
MHKRIIIFILFFSFILVFGDRSSVFFAPYQEAMNPVIRVAGSLEEEINCEIRTVDDNYTFEVDYTDTRSTESYIMENIPYSPELDFENIANLGTPLTFNGIDEFAPTVNFFPFSFFDETTNRLAIGENGLISLDPQQGGQINLRYPSANIPNSTLTRNAIFAAHYDLRIHGVAGAGVYYKIIGAFPARKLVITYVNAQVFYCTDSRTTSVQVVLEELTNIIRVHVKEKSLACGAITNSVLGIQNKYGNLGYSPTGRNYNDGDWSANQESYEFIPNGERLPTITWIEGGYTPNNPANNIIGTGETITVNADLADLQYTVEVRYPNYRNELGEIYDLILTDDIQVSPFYPIALDGNVIFCNETVDLTQYYDILSLNPPQNFNFTFYYDAALTNQITNPANFSFPGENITIYVKVAYSNTCFDVSTLDLSSLLDLLQINPDTLELYICDNVYATNPEGVENTYQLSLLNNLLLGNFTNGNINYYNSATATTPIRNLNISSGSQIWLDVTVSGSNGCRTPRIGPVTLLFYDVPKFVNVPDEVEILLCDKKWDYKEEFDANQTWQSVLADNGLITNNPNHIISVYESQAHAISGSNALTQVLMDVNDPTYNPFDNSRNAHLFIRIEDGNGCFSIEEIHARIRFYGIDAVDTPLFNLCVNTDTSIPIDLSCFLDGADFNNDGNFTEGMFNQIFFEDGSISQNIADVYDISYHATQGHAEAGTNPISPNQTVTAQDTGTKNFYVRFTLCEACTPDGDDCFTVKRIRFRVVSTQPDKTTLDVCHQNDENTLVSNLSIFNLQLFSNPNNYAITYFASNADAQNNTNAITSYTFTGNDYLWVRIRSTLPFNNTSCFTNSVNPCEGIYRIRFVYGAVIEPIDFPEQHISGVCDNNADGEELYDVTIFEDSIYAGEATFAYYANMNPNTLALSGAINDPTQVRFTTADNTNSATRTIFVKLTYADNSCYEIVRLTITLDFLPGIETSTGFLCACLPNPREYSTFDLTMALDQMYLPENEQNNNPFSEMVVSYYNYYLDAINGVNEIYDPTSYHSIRGEEEIFVRFYSTVSGCFSINTLTLKNLVLPVPIPGRIDVCDTNINGKYDIILNDLNGIVMPGNTENYYFSYFWNYEDAENAVNPIIQVPDSENPIDFFYEFNNLPPKIYVRVDADNGDCPNSTVEGGSICAGVNEVILNIGNNIASSFTEIDLPPVCETFEETGEINNPTYNDGIASGIDLTAMESTILTQIRHNADQIRFLYYATIADMTTDPYPYGTHVIDDPTNFTNQDNFGNPILQVFVKIEYEEFELCPIYIPLNINVLPGPELFPEEEYYICPNGLVDIMLNIPPNENVRNYSFEWILPDGSVVTEDYELIGMSQIGIYSVKITDTRTNCESPYFDFVVAEINPPVIQQLIVQNENSIQVIATGFEGLIIEYSIDGENFQLSNTFYNLQPGVHTFWVRYRYNNQMCLGEPKSTIILNIFNIITPNGDGYNDCITFNNLFVFGNANTTLLIYDRYGKEIFAQSSNTVIEWCGTYGGRVLPSTSYWYKLILPDGRERSGHITLKNY